MRINRTARRAAVVAALVAALGGCSGPPAASPSTAPPSTVAATVRLDGRVIPFTGPQRWTTASIPSRSSRALTVFATGSADRGGTPCGPPVLRFHVDEDARVVRVLVAEYQEPLPPDTGCPAVGHLPSPHRVELRSALGDRRLVDAGGGTAPRLLVGTDWPDIVRPPGSPAAAVLQRRDADSPVERSWAYPDGRGLALDVQSPAALREVGPYGRIVRQLEIGGAPATVYATGGERYGVVDVVWTPNPDQTLQVRLSNSPQAQWSLDDAVAVARSVTGYRRVDSGRLPQPTTPGTAAASYNSADGPVHGVMNLLKSSGVYLGVNCRGDGDLVVTLRGTPYRFRCADRLRHEVRMSTGAPDEVFRLDVDADPGVRWAVTLARASLDGS